MNANQAARLKVLEECLSIVARAPVEITVRGDTRFTWYLPKRNEAAAQRLASYAKEQPAGCDVEIAHDHEIGTCVYVDFHA